MANQNEFNWRVPRKAGAYLGAIALGFTALLLPACNNQQEIAEDQTNVTAEDVAEAPEEVPAEDAAQELVTVRGEVEETVDDSGLLMQSEDGSILVINATGTPFVAPTEAIPVQATGDSVQFVLADIESQYGLDLDPNLYVDYENQPAIIAESLALAPTPEQLAENPEAFYDQVIAVEGDVRGVYSPNTFAMFEEGWIDDQGLLIVGADEVSENEVGEIQEGENVTVTGRLRPFNRAELEQEFELGLEPDVLEEFEQTYTDRPVIIADGVYPSAVDN